MTPITHDPDQHHFTTPGGAILSYTIDGDRYVFDHTEVPPALRGQGVAGQLAKAALEHAREHDWKIVPACSYIELTIQRHPEYASLL